MMKTPYEITLAKSQYIALRDLKVGRFASVFGVIVHVSPIKVPQQSGKNYSCSLKITDPTLNSSSITINIFRPDGSLLPTANIGDIIFTRNVKVKMFNNSPQLTNEREMFYVCVDPYTRKAKMAQDRMVHFTRSDAEIIALLHQWSLNNISQVQAARVVSIGRPILTTQGIYEDPSRYFDYIGMVVGCYPEEGPAHKTNLVLTDFTDNPMPFMDDKGDYRLDIEYTKLLQCTLWDENSVRCPKLESGDYVLLRNCSRNEKNRNALEISMHGDRTGSTQSRNRVEILKPSDSRLKELLERKSRYVSTRHNSAKDVASLIGWGDDPLRTKVKDLKGHKSLKDIKESQQPGLYLTRAIIRKMSPNNVEDWIVGQCKHCRKFYKEPISLCDTCEGLNVPVFKVVFGIFDGTDEVPLVVFDKEAEMLFSGLSAEDAYIDESGMEQLRKLAKLIRHDNKDIYYDIGLYCYDTPGFGQTFRITRTEFIENNQA